MNELKRAVHAAAVFITSLLWWLFVIAVGVVFGIFPYMMGWELTPAIILGLLVAAGMSLVGVELIKAVDESVANWRKE